MKLFVDFESFYDTANDYGLEALGVVSYVRDPRFKVHGACFAVDNHPFEYVRNSEIPSYLSQFAGENVEIIAHNAKFDGFVLSEIYNFRPGRYVCTQGMATAALGTTIASVSLDHLSRHFAIGLKGEMKTDGTRDLSEEQHTELESYCLQDGALLRRLFYKLHAVFPKSQYWPLHWTIRAFCEPSFRLDVQRLETAASAEAERREALFSSPLAVEAAGRVQPVPKILKSGKPGKVRVVSPRDAFTSNPTFTRILEGYGYPVPLKTSPKGNRIPAVATGDGSFLDMVDSDDPRLSELCEIRLAAKSSLLETRARRLATIAPTGPWPFDVVFSGAKQTHRFSGGASSGGNPQNFPSRFGKSTVRGDRRALRASVCAPAGHLIVAGDFSAIEPRISSALAQEKILVDVFALPNGDPYIPFGSKFFGRPITKADKTERDFAKAAILGLGYGMGAKKFVAHARSDAGQIIDVVTAKKTVDLYRSTYRSIVSEWSYLDKLLSDMIQGLEGEVKNAPFLTFRGPEIRLPSGLFIRYPNLRRDEDGFVYTCYREKGPNLGTYNVWGGTFLENLCQGLAGELCKIAIEKFETETDGQIRAYGQLHDEILTLPTEEDAPAAAHLLEEIMSTPPSWWPDLPVKAEVGSGKNWLEAKP